MLEIIKVEDLKSQTWMKASVYTNEKKSGNKLLGYYEKPLQCDYYLLLTWKGEGYVCGFF